LVISNNRINKKKISSYIYDGNVLLHEWNYVVSKRSKLVVNKTGELGYDKAEPLPTDLVTWVFDEGSFTPTAKLVGDKRYSIICDYLGTPVEAYDEDGERVWECELGIYGQVRECKGDQHFVPFRYQGQYEDRETGLYYNRFRYYSPDSGGYLSQDPIGLAGENPNIYAYVEDVNGWIDPLGLEEVLTSGNVYRMGSGTDNNLTPRPIKDTTSGLSTSLDKPTKGKYQTIDVGKLEGTGLEAVNDHGKHVSIKPKDDPDFKKLEEWASTRGTDTQHKYTKTMQGAKVCQS